MDTLTHQDGKISQNHRGTLVSIVSFATSLESTTDNSEIFKVLYSDEHRKDASFVFLKPLPKEIEGHEFTLRITYQDNTLKQVISQYLWDISADKEYSFQDKSLLGVNS